MRVGDLVRLDVKLKRIPSPFQVIENMAYGKRVLNVGAVGGIQCYLPNAKNAWLHEKILKHAIEVIGIDIDTENINYAAKYGYKIVNANCETFKLDHRFDLIVMSDVIEHVDAPVLAIKNLLTHLSDDGCIIITTPNATAANVLIRSFFRRSPHVYWDHVALYLPEHFQAICDRLHCHLNEVLMFDHIDKRSWIHWIKSIVFKSLTFVSPRLSSAFMVIIKK